MARLNINGKVRDIDVEGDTPLLWVIREQAGLAATGKPMRNLPLKNAKLRA